MGTEEHSLSKELCERLTDFNSSFIKFLKSKKLSAIIQTLVDKIEIELFVWSSQSNNPVAASLNDNFKPIIIRAKHYEQIEFNGGWDLRILKSTITKKERRCYIFSNDSCMKYSTSIKYTDEFSVVWGIVTDEPLKTAESIIAKVLLDFLIKCCDDFDFFFSADIAIWQEKDKKFNFNIMDAYVNKIFDELPIPPEEIIRKVSFKNYEKSEICASICIISTEEYDYLKKSKQNSYVLIEESSFFAKDMKSEKNISSIRKMLQTCNDDNCLIVKDDSNSQIVGMVNKEQLHNLQYKYKIEFKSRGQWSLCIDNREILRYSEGTYSIDEPHENFQFMERVKSIEPIKDEMLEKFGKIFKTLRECPHGALMIVGNSKDIRRQVKRLCDKYHKGTRIVKLDLSIEENLPLIRGLASIDGAVMVDYDGWCYAFGVILDGYVKVVGDAGRGSRYNSSVNYIAYKNRYAVIFSEDEDKGIEVINGNKIKEMKNI